jgi:hypothetical protein
MSLNRFRKRDANTLKHMNVNITPDEGLVVLGILAALVVVAVVLGVHLASR